MKQYIVKVYDDRIEWYNQEGKLHREGDLPAIEYVNGYKAYYINGKLHRDGELPAIEFADGSKEYWVGGKRHREGGLPAIEYASGTKEFWVNVIGKVVSRQLNGQMDIKHIMSMVNE